MVLPNFFQNANEQRIASYDFTDLASGTGLERFYAATVISGGLLYVLTPNQIYSDAVVLSSGTLTNISTAAFVAQEYNFDSSEFNLPRTVNGKMDLLIPWGVIGQTSATDNDTIYHLITLKKLQGSTETNISNVKTGERTYGPIDTQIKTFLEPCVMEVPQTNIKKGEQLRINLKQYARSGLAANGSRKLFIGVDPQNRLLNRNDGQNYLSSGQFDTSTMFYDIPFKIVL